MMPKGIGGFCRIQNMGGSKKWTMPTNRSLISLKLPASFRCILASCSRACVVSNHVSSLGNEMETEVINQSSELQLTISMIIESSHRRSGPSRDRGSASLDNF